MEARAEKEDTMIRIALIALALASPATAQEPPRQSAQCLTEIAALTGERLDMFDTDKLARAQRKADALYGSVQRIMASRVAVDSAHRDAMVVLGRQEAEGIAPRGAVEIADRDHRRERERDLIEDRVMLTETPNCEWPEGFGAEVSGS